MSSIPASASLNGTNSGSANLIPFQKGILSTTIRASKSNDRLALVDRLEAEKSNSKLIDAIRSGELSLIQELIENGNNSLLSIIKMGQK